MSVTIKTLDDYGFLLCFIGGILAVVLAILSLIVTLIGENISWFVGGGFIGTANLIAGTIVSIFFGAFAIVIGLKLFHAEIRRIVVKVDLIITAIIMFVIGIVVFGVGGLLIIIGGVLVLVYRLGPEGTRNTTGK
ncbi:MAG: hypothetical protein ACFFDW_11795 [Candidatus Thorarchaeota archaeon]